MRILCTAKDSHIFSTKNNSVFVTLADICFTNLYLNDIVKLTMLGPVVFTGQNKTDTKIVNRKCHNHRSELEVI